MDIIDLANFLQIHWLPLLAGLVNFVWVYLEYKASIWLWPVGIVLPILYIAVSWDALYIGNIVINIYYLITSIIGWIMWLRKGDNEEETPIRHAHPRELVLALLGILILSVPAYYLLDGNSSMPSLDAVATVTSFIGMIFLSKKIAEHWFCWIIANSLSSIIFFNAEDSITTVVFIVNLTVSILGLIRWYKIIRETNEQTSLQ